MSIHQMILISKTPYGRLINFVLALGIFNLGSCHVYKPVETSLPEVSATQQIIDHTESYHFFVHDGYNSYELKNPVFNADGSLSGMLQLTVCEQPDSTWGNKERKAYWNDHKYDINIYANVVLSDLRADLASTGPQASQEIRLTNGMIEKMTITSIDMESQASGAAMVVLGLIVAVTLVVLIILLIGASEGGGGDGSGSGSGSGSD